MEKLKGRLEVQSAEIAALQDEHREPTDRKRKRQPKEKRTGGKASVQIKMDLFDLCEDTEEDYECRIDGCDSIINGSRTTSFYIHFRESHPKEFRFLLQDEKYSISNNTEVQNLINKFSSKKGESKRPKLSTIKIEDDV